MREEVRKSGRTGGWAGRLRGRLKRQSLKLKLVGTTILLFLVTVSLVSFLSYDRYTRDFQRQSNASTRQTLDQLSLNIDNYIDDLFRLSLSPYNNLQVLQLLDEPPPGTDLARLMRERQIEDFLGQMIVTPRLDILQVYIITATDVYMNGRATLVEPLEPNFRDEAWYRDALSTQKAAFLSANKTIKSNPGVKVFSIVKQLRSLRDTTKPLAVIKVDANYSGIANLADRVDLGDRGGLVIADRGGNVIYSSLRGPDEAKMVSAALASGAGQFHLKENGEKYLVATSPIERADWLAISVGSVKEMNKSAAITRNFTILIAAFCSLFACVVLYWLVRGFLRPLMRLVGLMKQVKLGHLSLRFADARTGDEIGYIGASFNTMLDRIEEMMQENTRLTKEVFETRYLQKEAQIHALLSQIRPHFIYNTLHTIGALIQMGRTEQATDNLEKLSLILRGFASTEQTIPLRRELELLEAYLGIQQSRFGDRLRTIVEVDGSLLDAAIPAVLLQPIVENAVVHSCEARREPTTIRVAALAEEGVLTLAVSDDGVGIGDAKLAELRGRLADGGALQLEAAGGWELRRGIGLVNVHNRLRMRCGEPYGLTVDSNPGEGTTVRATLPLLETFRPKA
ncbi:sensor histidine kinase [Cohnella sp. GCM10012308]|uniref:sensor histidine kinase n=1 Tax=Cohnella sp. GCM10012308 TaxID=3317329 RepID=UPI003615F2EA